MQAYSAKFSHRMFFKSCAVFLIFVFSFSFVFPPYIVQAQVLPILNLPIPGTMVTQTPGYIPTLIKGIEINPQNPFQFNFIIDTGESNLQGQELEDESLRVIKYFLASLTVPEKEVWVNLSPYEKDRIIPESFGKTGMGMDLLAEDYLLKQLTASLMYPEKELGKKFWDRVHARAQKEYGATDIASDMFHKVWIVPKDAEVVQIGNKAFVAKSSLEVLLEEDYVALRETSLVNHESESQKRFTNNASRDTAAAKLQTEIMREIIIPEIEKEVNEGRNFARLRQIYNATILATWFKLTLKESILGKIYVDQNKVLGIDGKDLQTKEEIYDQYVEAFKKGVYDYIKEDEDVSTGQIIPRRYFSGGYSLEGKDGAMLSKKVKTGMTVVGPEKGSITAEQRRKVSAATKPGHKDSQILSLLVNLTSQNTEEPFREIVPTDEEISALKLSRVKELKAIYRKFIEDNGVKINRLAKTITPESEERIRGEIKELLDENVRYDDVFKRLMKYQQQSFLDSDGAENLAESGFLPGQYEPYQEILKLEIDIVVLKEERLGLVKKEGKTEEDEKWIQAIEARIEDKARQIKQLRKVISDEISGDDVVVKVMEEHPERVLPAIRKKFPNFPEITSQALLDSLYSAMSSGEFLVHDVTLEAILLELEGDAQTALGKGGLGFLAGETFGAYKNGIGYMPLYDHPMKKDGQPTPKSIDWDNEKGINRVYVKNKDGQEEALILQVEMAGRLYETGIYWSLRKGKPVFLFRNADIFDQLYPEPSDGPQRMWQYGFIAKAYVALGNYLRAGSEILRINEAQLVFVLKAVEKDVLEKGDDSVFAKQKSVGTNHTPERAALPVFAWKREDLEDLLGPELIDNDMYQDVNKNITYNKDGQPVIRAAEVMARKVEVLTTVSEEHSEVTKRHVLPQFAWKTTYVQNGSDPDQWHSETLEALIEKKGFDNITGKDLFEIKQGQKILLNEWLKEDGFNQFEDLSRPLFEAVRRLVEYKEQGIFIPMARWMTGDADKEYDTPWGKQAGLGANLLIGGPISDGVGEGWANEFRELQEDPSIKGKLVFIDKTGTDIMGLATSLAEVHLESPRPTREASGTSYERALLNGTLVIATATGGPLAVIEHGKNSWLVDVFKTGGFTREFDELAEVLDDPSHPRYGDFVERYRIGAQKLFGQYMTEVVSLHNAYKKESDPRILQMMKKAFVDAHEKIGIDRMMDSYQELFKHVLDGTGAAGYESRQIPASNSELGIVAAVELVAERYKFNGEVQTVENFLRGRGPMLDVIKAFQDKMNVGEVEAQKMTITLWLMGAYGLDASAFDEMYQAVDHKGNNVFRSVKLSVMQGGALEKNIQSLSRIAENERRLRLVESGEMDIYVPEAQHLARKELARSWRDLADRQVLWSDAAMLTAEKFNKQVGPLLTTVNKKKIAAGQDPRIAVAKKLVALKKAGKIPKGVYLSSANTRKLAVYLLVESDSGNGAFALKVQKNTMDVISALVSAHLLDPDVQVLNFEARREYKDRSQYEVLYVKNGGFAEYDMRIEAANFLFLFTDEGWIKPEFADQALLATGEVGGIDLNSAFLNLKIRRDDKGMLLPVSQQPIQELMAIDGLIPVIINITPIQSLPMMLGLEKGVEDNGIDQLSQLDVFDKVAKVD